MQLKNIGLRNLYLLIVLTIIVLSSCRNLDSPESKSVVSNNAASNEIGEGTTPFDSSQPSEVLETAIDSIQNTKKDTVRNPCLSSLGTAVWEKNVEEVQRLIESGCPVESDNSALWLSVSYGTFVPECFKIVQLLLNAGADPNLGREKSMSPFHKAAGYGHSDILKLLIEYGGDVNTFNEHAWQGPTPLTLAISQGKYENAKLLVDAGADLSPPDGSIYSSALFVSVSKGDFEMTKYLLSKGANPNLIRSGYCDDCYTSTSEITPIFLLLNRKDNLDNVIEFIDLFEEYGVNFNAENFDGLNLIEYAAPHTDAQIIKDLLSRDIKAKESVLRAAKFQNNEVLELLLDYGEDPNKGESFNRPLVQAAICCGDGANDRALEARMQTIELLLKAGADPTLGEPSLLSVARKRKMDIVIETCRQYGYE